MSFTDGFHASAAAGEYGEKDDSSVSPAAVMMAALNADVQQQETNAVSAEAGETYSSHSCLSAPERRTSYSAGLEPSFAAAIPKPTVVTILESTTETTDIPKGQQQQPRPDGLYAEESWSEHPETVGAVDLYVGDLEGPRMERLGSWSSTLERCWLNPAPSTVALLPETTVFLNVYDVADINHYCAYLGLGVHHSGVQVYGTEIAFGRCAAGTGVFTTNPRETEPHVFREQLVLGVTPLSREQVQKIIVDLKADLARWGGTEYHLLRKNCNVFSEYLVGLLLTPEARWRQHQRLQSFTAIGGGRKVDRGEDDIISPVPRSDVQLHNERFGAGSTNSNGSAAGHGGTRRDDICREVFVADSGEEEVLLNGRYVKLPRLIPAYVDRLARLGRTYLPSSWISWLDQIDQSM